MPTNKSQFIKYSAKYFQGNKTLKAADLNVNLIPCFVLRSGKYVARSDPMWQCLTSTYIIYTQKWKKKVCAFHDNVSNYFILFATEIVFVSYNNAHIPNVFALMSLQIM